MTRFRVGPMVWVFGALFVVVTVLVAHHATRHLDQSVYDWLTPTGSWNQTHQLVSDVPDWTAPHFQLVAFGIFVLVLVRRRRSLTPILVAGLLVGLAAFLVLAVKRMVPAVDTGGHLSGAGSYPSGHMAMTVATVGGVLLLLTAKTRWWQWLLVSLVPFAMACCLLYGAIHWTSDVIGGALLGATVVALVAGVPDRAGVKQVPARERSDAPAR